MSDVDQKIEQAKIIMNEKCSRQCESGGVGDEVEY